MAGETTITLVGNLTADPELRFTPSGAAVANFTVASTPRTFDRQTSEWRDGDAMFLNCAVWRQAAENVRERTVLGHIAYQLTLDVDLARRFPQPAQKLIARACTHGVLLRCG